MKMGKKSWAVIALFLLFAAACAQGGTTKAVTSPSAASSAGDISVTPPPATVAPPAVATPVSTQTAAAPQPATAAPANAPAINVPAGGTQEIAIQGSTFTPSLLTIKAGTTVTWINKDDVTHDIICDLPGTFSGQAAQNGGKFSYTFTKAGTFNYSCDLHDCMIGTITVQ
jgi:plastocyanin